MAFIIKACSNRKKSTLYKFKGFLNDLFLQITMLQLVLQCLLNKEPFEGSECVFSRSSSPPYCSDHLLYFPLWLQPRSLLLGSATAAICPRCNPPVTRSTAVVTICTGQQQAWKAHFLRCIVQLPPRTV